MQTTNRKMLFCDVRNIAWADKKTTPWYLTLTCPYGSILIGQKKEFEDVMDDCAKISKSCNADVILVPSEASQEAYQSMLKISENYNGVLIQSPGGNSNELNGVTSAEDWNVSMTLKNGCVTVRISNESGSVAFLPRHNYFSQLSDQIVQCVVAEYGAIRSMSGHIIVDRKDIKIPSMQVDDFIRFTKITETYPPYKWDKYLDARREYELTMGIYGQLRSDV